MIGALGGGITVQRRGELLTGNLLLAPERAVAIAVEYASRLSRQGSLQNFLSPPEPSRLWGAFVEESMAGGSERIRLQNFLSPLYFWLSTHTF